MLSKATIYVLHRRFERQSIYSHSHCRGKKAILWPQKNKPYPLTPKTKPLRSKFMLPKDNLLIHSAIVFVSYEKFTLKRLKKHRLFNARSSA